MDLIESTTLFGDVNIFTLKTLKDSRGNLTELFRKNWINQREFIQWNFVTSHKNTFRGVHIHPKHSDFLIVLSGKLLIGLLDLRVGSTSYNTGRIVELSSTPNQAIYIPPGVAHGFYSPESSTHIYGVDHYWNLQDELGCNWKTTKDYLHWPFDKPILSERDQQAKTLDELRQQLQS